MGYSGLVVKGVSWTTLIRISTRALSLLKTIIVARVLSPNDFGLFGIATLVLAFVEIFTETGVNLFLLSQKDTIDKYLNTAWVVSIIRGVLITCIIALSSPFVAAFFNASDSLPLLLLVSFVPLIRGFINPAVIKFQKELQFRKEFYYRTSVFLFEVAVSSILVLLTKNISGLIWGLLISVIFEVIISFKLISPTPRFIFQKELFGNIIRFGKWITASTIFNYFYQHGDDIAVGKLLGTGNLGIYDMAYRVSLIPLSDISEVISKVSYPVYVQIAGDRNRLLRAYLKTLGVICVLTVPVGVILFFFPELVISLVLGDKWLSAVLVLKVLAVFGVVRAISVFSSYIFLSIGKQHVYTSINLIGLLGLLITIIPLIHLYGIVGAAYAALLGTCITIPVIAYFLYIELYKKPRIDDLNAINYD